MKVAMDEIEHIGESTVLRSPATLASNLPSGKRPVATFDPISTAC
jgi:hypothetical protein